MKDNKKDGADVIEEALKVYKIPEEHVFTSGFDEPTDVAVIVTNGGKKIRHKKGEAVKFALTIIDITGKAPKKKEIWSKRFNCMVEVDQFPGKDKVWIEKFNQWISIDEL